MHQNNNCICNVCKCAYGYSNDKVFSIKEFVLIKMFNATFETRIMLGIYLYLKKVPDFYFALKMYFS